MIVGGISSELKLILDACADSMKEDTPEVQIFEECDRDMSKCYSVNL